jgi:hypothetical protein
LRNLFSFPSRIRHDVAVERFQGTYRWLSCLNNIISIEKRKNSNYKKLLRYIA